MTQNSECVRGQPIFAFIRRRRRIQFFVLPLLSIVAVGGEEGEEGIRKRERQSSKEQVGGSFFIIFHSHVLFQSRGGGTCKQCCKIHSNTPRVETSGGRQGLPSACKTRREGRGKLLWLQVFLKFASGFLSPPFLLYGAEHSSYTNAVCTYGTRIPKTSF